MGKSLDLTNQKFGRLIALYKTDKRNSSGQIYWHCQCDCGNECDVNAYCLKMGYTKSCGCIKKSYGEELIFSILRESNLFFQEEYSFKDCIFKGSNRLARFDFYVDNKYLIEFDGKQHFIENAGWGEPLSEIQKRDNYKNEYCLKNNIPLYRIPYTEINNIKNISDILQEKFLVKK